MAVDVAREGLVERLRALRWERVRAGLALTAGWIMVFPQGLVAAALGQFDGVPPSWFVALHVGGDELWLVAGAMVGSGSCWSTTACTRSGRPARRGGGPLPGSTIAPFHERRGIANVPAGDRREGA